MEVKFFGHFLIGRSGMGGCNSRYILGDGVVGHFLWVGGVGLRYILGRWLFFMSGWR